MPELELLPPAAAAAALTAAGEPARGLLGLDPVTQNEALLARELTRREAAVFRYGDTVLGCRVNAEQPRQSEVASTTADPAALGALLDFLHAYKRCVSFVALVPDALDISGYTALGFTEVGLLREHRFAAGRYHDVRVLHGTHGVTASDRRPAAV
ncbi:hypothetical protein ABII15_14040 [Streptomyces sp. HUAS MG91]|uniref:GNAT family N-acetyltransferase n=1 Tax=Streptomyces tabacisoli TaxID=3156398 RepID=A0AAU8IRY0_9ACTN